MKICLRCRSPLLPGQQVCPQCGKPRRQAGRVRCRQCGRVSYGYLETCPHCGEPLKRSWLRPMLITGLAAALVFLGVFVGPKVVRWAGRLRPMAPVSTVRALVKAVPSLLPEIVQVPSLTPSLTPSSTPTPTLTPTPTPTPSLTPTPTHTPTPTITPTPIPSDTPTPTATRPAPRRTSPPPTQTPTPAPALPAPTLLGPEDRVVYHSDREVIKLSWTSSYTLRADEYFEVTLRYTQQRAEVKIPYRLQSPFLYLGKELYLQADQETDRLYSWSVRLVRRALDAAGAETFGPISPASGERSFYWQP